MAILSTGYKPDICKSHSCLKCSSTIIWGPHSNFVEYQSFLESNSLDILTLCETNLNYPIDSGNFFVMGYPPLIQKDSIKLMHGLAVYVKSTSFCTELISRTLCGFLRMFSAGFSSFIVLFLFPWSITSFSLCLVFDCISCNIDQILSSNPSVNVFVFWRL